MSTLPAVLVFPGQGSQYAGMLDGVPVNDTLGRLIDAAEALSGLELRAISSAATTDTTSLTDTRAAQPLLYLTDWAWGVALLDSGLNPVAVAGHSLGEFAALSIAGVFSVEAGLELVIERSRLMAEAAAANAGTMVAIIGLNFASVTESIAHIDDVWVANDNSTSQVVISGTEPAVESATLLLQQKGARRIVPLMVSGAFHSPLMEPARAAFEEILDGTEFRNASIPVIQNTMPSVTTDAATIRRRLAVQIAAPVRWTETMRTVADGAPVAVVEAGPGSVLRSLARGYDGVVAVSVEDAGLEYILEEVISR